MKVVFQENIFRTVRENVSMLEAARFYGLEVDRSHNAVCPFHPDKNPSLHIYEDHYHCFGCGAHGDVTDFAARLFGISQYEAAKKLCYDFGIDVRMSKPTLRHVNPDMHFRLWIQRAENALNAYLTKLCQWRSLYAPHSPEEIQHPRFVESLQMMDYTEYLYETVKHGSDNDRRFLFTENRDFIDRIIERFQKQEFANPVQRRRAI